MNLAINLPVGGQGWIVRVVTRGGRLKGGRAPSSTHVRRHAHPRRVLQPVRITLQEQSMISANLFNMSLHRAYKFSYNVNMLSTCYPF